LNFKWEANTKTRDITKLTKGAMRAEIIRERVRFRTKEVDVFSINEMKMNSSRRRMTNR